MASKTQKAASQAPRNSHADKKDPITVPEAIAEMLKPFDWQKALEEEYGRVIRDRDLPGLLTAILTELVRNRRK